MYPFHDRRFGAMKTKFTAVDAARLALDIDTARPVLSPKRGRLLQVAATMWCGALQFPTVREIQTAIDLASTSSVIAGFGRLIELQAAVIRSEWHEIEELGVSSADERVGRVVRHAEDLAAVDRMLLRLPGLVWSAVATADPLRVAAQPGLGAALHVLAAASDLPPRPPDRVTLRRVILAGDRFQNDHPEQAVPA